MLPAVSRWFFILVRFGDQQKSFGATLSTESYRDMGHGMGLRDSPKIPLDFSR